MMNPILKQELKSYFDEVKKRVNIVNTEMKREDYDIKKSNYRYELNKRMGLIAIDLLNKEKWDFEKGRVNAHRIGLIDSQLKVKKYKHHKWYSVNFFSEYGEKRLLFDILPVGFDEVVRQVNEHLNTITDICNFQFHDKSETKINVEFIDNGGVKEDIITRISMDKEVWGVSLENHYVDTDSQYQMLFNNEVYKILLGLLEKRKRFYEEMISKIKEVMTKIDKVIVDDFDKILITARLKQ